MRRVYLVDLRATGFRNLEIDSVSWNPSTNLVLGANGQGKTNLLEAVAVLGNLRSFRTPTIRRVVANGCTEFALEGRIETHSGPLRLRQRVIPGPPLDRRLAIGGAPTSIAEYLAVFPVVAISGADRELVVGGPGGRRLFLDRLSFLLKTSYFHEISTYRKVLRQRNAAIIRAIDDHEMEAWEERLAAAAACVVARRKDAVGKLLESFQPIYDELRGDEFPDIDLVYRGEAELDPAEKVQEVEEYYQKRYNETRARDRRIGFTGDGPHRHDLGLRSNGKSVRHMLSSGQVKVVAAALRLASLKQVESERGELLPVIIDDVDAELDAAVLAGLIDHLVGERQLFLSSADRHVFDKLATGSSRYEIRRGAVFKPAGERADE
jgi:DNA replication and repair protein RecF